MLTKSITYKQIAYFCAMKFLNQLFRFYLNASIHVALAVCAFLKISEIYLQIPEAENLNYFVFFSTITGYNFVKYFGIAKFHHRSLTTNLKIIQVFSFGSFLAMCYFAFKLPCMLFWYLLPLGLLTLLYAIPFLSGFQKSLRSISYLKIVIVALVWAVSTVILPVILNNSIVDFVILMYAFQRFLIVMILILPFDIRDLKYDAISLQTIPQKIGVEKTKKLGFVLLAIAACIEFVVSTDQQNKMVFLGFLVLLLFFLMRAQKGQSTYYSSFWVEALPIFWFLALLFV